MPSFKSSQEFDYPFVYRCAFKSWKYFDMIFKLARGRNLLVSNKDNSVFASRTIGLIVVPWKFNVLKTSILALFRQIFGLRTSKSRWATINDSSLTETLYR